jgi:hypothetical protein
MTGGPWAGSLCIHSTVLSVDSATGTVKECLTTSKWPRPSTLDLGQLGTPRMRP